MALWSDTAVTNLNREWVLCLYFVLGETQFFGTLSLSCVSRANLHDLTDKQSLYSASLLPSSVYQVPRCFLLRCRGAEKVF